MKINTWKDIVAIAVVLLFVLFVIYAIWTGMKQTIREIRCKRSGGHEWEEEIDPFSFGLKSHTKYYCKRCRKIKTE